MTKNVSMRNWSESKATRTTLGKAMELAAFNVRTKVWSNDGGMSFVRQVNDGVIDEETVDDWFEKVMEVKNAQDAVVREVFGN